MGHAGAVPITDAMIGQWRRWEAEGMSRREISRRSGVSSRRVMTVLGKREPRQTGNPRPMVNIYVYRRPFRMAAKRARELGYRLTSGINTGGGNVGLLVEAIGKGEVVALDRKSYATLYMLAEARAEQYAEPLPNWLPKPVAEPFAEWPEKPE